MQKGKRASKSKNDSRAQLLPVPLETVKVGSRQAPIIPHGGREASKPIPIPRANIPEAYEDPATAIKSIVRMPSKRIKKSTKKPEEFVY